MYHHHCKEVLRLATKADFAKMQPLAEGFWAQQTRPLLSTTAGIAMVLRCDEIFYTALGLVLMVDILAPIPVPLVKEIRVFAKHMVGRPNASLPRTQPFPEP